MIATKEEQPQLQQMWEKMIFVTVSVAMRYARSLRLVGLVTFAFAILLFLRQSLTGYTISRPFAPEADLQSSNIYNSPPPMPLEEVLRELYKPLIPKIDQRNFRALDGKEYYLDNPPIWTKPLGKDFCIIDVDNRPMNNPNEFLNPNPGKWGEFHAYGAGVMNHYMYTLIHGYTYHFIQNPGYPDRKSTWCKMSALLEMLRAGDCRFVLLMDADAVMTNLELPFEWLLNRWGVTPTTAVTMPKDPLNNEPNYDSKGRVNINSGFVITQRMEAAIRIVEETIACPNNTEKYPKCDHFKFEGLCEQGVLSEYVRYEFPNDILEIECSDANGYPGSGRPCDGIFARHHWDRKHLAKDSLLESVITNLITRLKDNLINTPGVAMTDESRLKEQIAKGQYVPSPSAVAV